MIKEWEQNQNEQKIFMRIDFIKCNIFDYHLKQIVYAMFKWNVYWDCFIYNMSRAEQS